MYQMREKRGDSVHLEEKRDSGGSLCGYGQVGIQNIPSDDLRVCGEDYGSR